MKTIHFVILIFFSAFLFLGSAVIHADSVGLDIKKIPTVAGRIAHRYLKRLSEGKGGDPLVLALRLANFHQTLIIYDPLHDYSELLDSLRVGDIVTVYYMPLSTNSIGIDACQVEKNGRIIVDYADYSKRHSFASAILGIFGSIFLLIGIIGIWINWKTGRE